MCFELHHVRKYVCEQPAKRNSSPSKKKVLVVKCMIPINMVVKSACGKMNIVSFDSVSHLVHPLAELEEVGVVLAGVEFGRVRLGQERTPEGEKKKLKNWEIAAHSRELLCRL